jgi:hypothetical protein
MDKIEVEKLPALFDKALNKCQAILGDKLIIHLLAYSYFLSDALDDAEKCPTNEATQKHVKGLNMMLRNFHSSLGKTLSTEDELNEMVDG